MRAELHCHNEFSNFNVGDLDAPYDCCITIREQLDRARQLGLDAVFVTNHNTLDGYAQMLEYRNDHERFRNMRVFPAEEITTADGEHVIAYGLSEPISAGLGFHEVLDRIASQDAVSSAPHPFALIDALRERASECDLIEVFNSNNVDVSANIRASIFARDHGLAGVAGSDSHVLSTLGRCVNVIDSEDGLDDVLYSMRHGRIEIETTGYATTRETVEHLRYKLENSVEYVHEYLAEFHPGSQKLLGILFELFQRNPESHVWLLLCRISVWALRRISRKINFGGASDEAFRKRDVSAIMRMAV